MNETDKPAVNDTIPWEVLVNDESARAAFSARQLERIADSLLRMEEWIDRVASIQDGTIHIHYPHLEAMLISLRSPNNGF